MLRIAHEQINLKDKEIENLLAEIQKEKDERKEERFLFTLIIVLLLDLYFFMQMETYTGPLVIFLLELILLIYLARKWGIDPIIKILDKVLDMTPKLGKRN